MGSSGTAPSAGAPSTGAPSTGGRTVVVEGLGKSYGPVRAVDDVSFAVDRGEVFALLGPNGAGKTTSIEILEGFRDRDAGSVRVLGVDPGARRSQRWLRTRMGVVLQELAVEPYFTVRQVLSRNAGFYPSPRPVDEVIQLIGLAAKGDAKIKTLSGGQQRRLDVGLGIVGHPELLFLDEPTTGLDPSGRRASWDLVRQLAGEGTTVILTSHYMDEVEALADRVAVIAGGRVVATGTPTSIGGREVSAVTIRFRLPEGVAAAELPVRLDEYRGGEARIRTTDELAVLHSLTGWALERGLDLPGLCVSRVTLEDVYLQLTRSDQDPHRDGDVTGDVGEQATMPRRTAATMEALGDLRLVVRQVRYEQLAFWLNRVGAVFTVGFSVVFLVLLGAGAGDSRVSYLDNIKLVQYYVPGFVAYGVMAACFTTLCMSLVNRRETGLLKRLRLSPLPTWALLGAVFVSTMIVAVVQVVLLLVIGRWGFGVQFPQNVGAFVLALVVGAVCFTALGVAMSTAIPNQDTAGPVTSVVFFVLLFLSGLWFPLKAGSGLSQFSSWFPLRPFIEAVFGAFYVQRGESPWAWHDLAVVAVWGVAGAVVAVRRFRWAPRRG